jgi:uncharacterized protein (UPF0332 family)
MKQDLDKKNIEDLVHYRIDRAEKTLLEAQSLYNNGFYNATINRLYYACFYAVLALLVSNQISAFKHAGVKQMFGLHFVSNGKIDPSYGRFYSRLFNERITGDYDDFIVYEKETVNDLIPKSTEFIQEIRKLLNY